MRGSLCFLFDCFDKPPKKKPLSRVQLLLFSFFFLCNLFVFSSLALYKSSLLHTTKIPKNYFPLHYEKSCFEQGSSFNFLKNLTIYSVEKLEGGSTPKLLVKLIDPNGRIFKGAWKPFLTRSGFAPMDLLSYHLACYFHLQSTPPSFYLEIPRAIYEENGLEIIYNGGFTVSGVFISWIDGLSRGHWVKIHLQKYLEPVLGWCSSSFSCHSAFAMRVVFDYLIGNWDRFYNQHSIWWTDDKGKTSQSLILLDHNHVNVQTNAPLPRISQNCSLLNPFFSQLCNTCSHVETSLLSSLASNDPKFLDYLCRKPGMGTKLRLREFMRALKRNCLKLCSMRQGKCHLELDPKQNEDPRPRYGQFFGNYCQ